MGGTSWSEAKPSSAKVAASAFFELISTEPRRVIGAPKPLAVGVVLMLDGSYLMNLTLSGGKNGSF